MSPESMQKLIADGKTRQAIQALRSVSSQDEDWVNKVRMQSSRFETLENQKHEGTLTPAEYTLEKNKIDRALLHLIEQMPADARVAPGPGRSGAKRRNLIIAAITFLAAVATITGYTLKDFWGKDTPLEIREPEGQPGYSDKTPPAPAEPQNSGPNLNTNGGNVKLETQGDQSPAVIGTDVNISYGKIDLEEEAAEATPDSVKTDSTKKK